MAFDYKKEYKEFYLPPVKPKIDCVPEIQFVSVSGAGDPNDENGEYKTALAVLYAISYTIKMSKMEDHRIDGYYDYVVPPLEGFWYQKGIDGIDYCRKDLFNWNSVIRLPDFVTQKDFDWAKDMVVAKKGLDCSKAKLFKITEGECVQIMHIGSYDNEPASVKLMDEFAVTNGYELDFSSERLHHEIYLSDPRKTAAEKLRTVIRHPLKKIIS